MDRQIKNGIFIVPINTTPYVYNIYYYNKVLHKYQFMLNINQQKQMINMFIKQIT